MKLIWHRAGQETKEFESADYEKFIVTGKLYRKHTRFSVAYSDVMQAMSINLWNGSVWGVLPNGKRKLLKRVIN